MAGPSAQNTNTFQTDCLLRTDRAFWEFGSAGKAALGYSELSREETGMLACRPLASSGLYDLQMPTSVGHLLTSPTPPSTLVST